MQDIERSPKAQAFDQANDRGAGKAIDQRIRIFSRWNLVEYMAQQAAKHGTSPGQSAGLVADAELVPELGNTSGSMLDQGIAKSDAAVGHHATIFGERPKL